MRKQTYQHHNIKVVAPRTGLPFDDYPPKVVFLSPKKIKPKDRELSDHLDTQAESSAMALGVILLIGLSILVVAVLGIVFSVFKLALSA